MVVVPRKISVGPFDNDKNVNKRFKFLQNLIECWWKRWYESVLPSLVPTYKWHQRHRNVKPGDVCLIRYANEHKGNYRLGRVNSIKKGSDGLVRSVYLVYNNANESCFREVDRPIHGIAVIVPTEEESGVINFTLNPEAKAYKPMNNARNPTSNPGMF